ncbi:keratin, type I cytoskeletal 9-like isoform X6 [Nilaparvata lugens]|uniref:keratin, type I cytoskeletal 9-like isoform X6 n=1 Tax=Nilaparvata lugens TaxID=108931 RepID=UPI00193EB6F6|nr:keratin, type I cytoskeletal 9-like isoform X6 [Nilaparvata lugens]
MVRGWTAGVPLLALLAATAWANPTPAHFHIQGPHYTHYQSQEVGTQHYQEPHQAHYQESPHYQEPQESQQHYQRQQPPQAATQFHQSQSISQEVLQPQYTRVESPPYPAKDSPKGLSKKANHQQLHRLQMQYLQELEADVVNAVQTRGIAETIKLEQKFQEEILAAAVETLTKNKGNPEKQAQDLKEIENLVKRDKRAVEVLTTLLGSSSGNKLGGGGAGGDDAGSSGSGTILNLLGPLLGSSSGGGTGGDGGDAGSGSGSILSIAGPLLGSSSGGGGGGGVEGESAGGSDSGSILNLVGPLLGSSSGTQSDADGVGEGGGGSNLLSVLSSLLGSSSGGGGGGSSSGGGDASGGGGGGSDLFGLSNSSGGAGGSVNGAKVGIIQQKLQLFLRLKFAIFTKILNTLTGVLGSSSGGTQAVPIHELKYPS